MEQRQLPERVRVLLGDHRLEPISIGRSSASTFRCVGTGEDRVLKIRPEDPLDTTLAGEADRLRWLAPHVAVPRVIDAGSDGSVEWLLMTTIPGSDATDPIHRGDLEHLIGVLGQGLRSFHDAVPVGGCPFDARTSTDVERARARVAADRVDATEFGSLYQGLSASELYEAMVGIDLPPDDDLVVLHGDYCAPNVMLHDGAITGYIDLGRSGVGDRHRDLAIASRSIAYNFGSHAVGLFLDAYGIERPDLARIDFFVMLDEFF